MTNQYFCSRFVFITSAPDYNISTSYERINPSVPDLPSK